MLRAVLGVVVGYIVMAVVVLATFTVAYLAMGTDRAFQPGAYDPTLLWIGCSMALGLIAAIAGGVVCRVIARSMRPCLVLAGLALGLGLVMAIPVLTSSKPDPGPRAGDVSNMDAMMKAKQPAWIALVNPFVGAIGVLIGARSICCGRSCGPRRAPE